MAMAMAVLLLGYGHHKRSANQTVSHINHSLLLVISMAKLNVFQIMF